ncbi:amiloride-sensitive cation channel 5-like protein, partial [Euroglyphus maynei]
MAGFGNGNNVIGDCNPNSRNYCKLIFKILIVLLSFAGFLYQATDICAHYFSYRTVVYTNTEQDSLVDLPSITFCLPTYFTKQSLEQLYSPYIKRNLEEMSAFKNQSMLDAIKPVIYETFQKQAFKDLSAAQILDRSISDDGIIECRLFYPPQHWPNLTRERMYEIVQYGLPCEEVTQVISSINANGKCFTFFSQLLTDNDSLKAYHSQSGGDSQMLEYQQYPQMTSFASSSASSASTRSTGPVAPPIIQHSRYVPVSHKISVNHGYRFHSG